MHKKQLLLILILTPILFLVIMISLQLIPNSWVRNNVQKSREIINVESKYHEAYYVPGINWLAASDGYSDDIYLKEQIIDRSHNILYSAMIPNYDRYWHGYSLFLRPLLIAFDLAKIRQILVISFMMLFAILIYLVIKHINMAVGLLLACAISLVNPPVIMISLQYSNMFLLTLSVAIALMVMLAKKRPNNEILLFFMVVGSLTSFFDLLTTPTITLGIPLLLWVAYRIQHQKTERLLKDVLLAGCIWFGGYIVAWAAKWLIGSLLLHKNIFLEASTKATYWSSDHSTIESRNVNALYVLHQWIKRLVLARPLVFVGVIGFTVGLVNLLRNRKKIHIPYWLNMLAIIIPTLIPIAWVTVVRQHSLEHQWFSYRHLVVAIFGCFLLLWYINRGWRSRHIATKN